MKKLTGLGWTQKTWAETRAQDIIEYVLFAGFWAGTAGAIVPGVATRINGVFSKIIIAAAG
jgi:hypothetical protein